MKTLMTSKRVVAWTSLVFVAPLLAACGGNYYQVTDTSSGKSYYTRDVGQEDGHVQFTDRASGDEVILNGVEIREITRQQYKNAVRK